jgi:hypothetical protein
MPLKCFAVLLVMFALCSCGDDGTMPVDAQPAPDAISDAAPSDAPMVDAMPVPDAPPDAAPCEDVYWAADVTPPPGATLTTVNGPAVLHPEGGLGVGADGRVSAAEGITIEWAQPVTMTSYETSDESAHQVQWRTLFGETLVVGPIHGPEVIWRLETPRLQWNGVAGETIVLRGITYLECQ